MACFVTAGAIDMKLCTCPSFGQITPQTKFQSDLILGLATKTEKTKSAVTPELMAGSSPSFYQVSVHLGRIHDRVFDLTFFSRSQRSKKMPRVLTFGI
jgi:hypothetical protein